MELGPGKAQPLPNIVVCLGFQDKKFQVILLKSRDQRVFVICCHSKASKQ